MAAEGVGDYEAAKEIYEASLANRQTVNPEGVESQVTRLIGLGHALNQLGELDGARQSLRRALDLAAEGEVGRDSLVTVHLALGEVERERGNYAEARTLFERVIEFQQEDGDRVGIVRTRLRLGLTLLGLEEYSAARKALTEALVLGEETRGAADRMVVDALFLLGMVAKEEGDWDQAARRLRQAIELQAQHDSSNERRLDELRRVLNQVLESSASAA